MILYVAAGGFFGAIARYCVNHCIKYKSKNELPVGTFVVNITGSFFMGLLIGLQLHTVWLTFLGTGFLGAFTTFSTFKMENLAMIKEKRHRASFYYILLSYGLGILLAFAGYCIGQVIHEPSCSLP